MVVLTFWLGNVLRATTACTFSTSQLPKVFRERQFLTLLTSKCASRHNGVHFFDIWTSRSAQSWGVLYILTSVCASRHNGVRFFDISTSKSVLNVVCLVHFDFGMCSAPQRRALFEHRNFEKWSEHGVFCSFWLPNMLRATTACTFSSLIWPDGSAPISEPTFRPSGATNYWKNIVFCGFPTFSRTCIFFLLTLSLLWSSLFCSSPLWLFLPLLFHLSILSEVWLLNFLR